MKPDELKDELRVRTERSELANKPCYPYHYEYPANKGGLTFRERLIIALASNPEIFIIRNSDGTIDQLTFDTIGNDIKNCADAIIKEMEK